jgi:hypothetical protein
MLSSIIPISTQQPEALRIIGPIFIVVGLVALVLFIVDPAGYFTKGFEDNPPFRWEVFPRTPHGYRAYMANGAGLMAVCGIVFAVVAY